MRNVTVVALAIVTAVLSGTAAAQSRVSDLAQDMASGRITLISASGNGNSSGAAVDAYLVNETGAERQVDVYLSQPIYLVNRGAGQNMIAIEVYFQDGRYQSAGGRSFITLEPRARTPVFFIAYCADFQSDNPSPGDSFSLGTVPPHLQAVLSNIENYSRANPDSDITVAAQVAVWIAQGESTTEIREKFPFTTSDERLARTFFQ